MKRLVRLVVAAIAVNGVVGSDKKDYYAILGIEKDADESAVKKAYRKLALKWHPDKNPDNREEAEKKFTDIAEAYEILSKPDTRKRYDNGGMDDFGGFGGMPDFDFGGFGGFGGGGGFAHANDIFKDFFGDSDPWADFDSFFDDVTFDNWDQQEPPKQEQKQKKQKKRRGDDPFADMFGGFGGGFGDDMFAGFGGFDDMFEMGGGGGSSFSFSSSSSMGSGGTFVRTETTIGPDGKRVTKKVSGNSDGSSQASIEEHHADGTVRKKSGRKAAANLEGHAYRDEF